MSISPYDRTPGAAFVRLLAFVSSPSAGRFVAWPLARPVALSILFGLCFFYALAAPLGQRAVKAQAYISAPLGNCLVGSLVVSPNVGSSENYIRGVAAIGPNDAWAVGHYINTGGINQTLTMHWDGTQWQVVPSPNFGSSSNYLYAVSATSSGEVWAVGHYIANTERTLTMRWNGSQWNIVSSPNNGQLSNNLRGVSVVSPTDVWAVGFYFSNNMDRTLTLHWNGNQWNVISSPNVGQGTNRLFAVSADSGGGVWAVGNYSPGTIGSFFTLAMQWDGAQWTIFSTPNPGGDYNLLIGVFSISLGDAWAVGFSTDGEGNPHYTLTAHWDGTQWSQVASPNSNLTENYLYSVSGISSGDVWAAGFAYNRVGTEPSQAVGLHWDGAQWTLASSANPGSTTNTLWGISAVSPGRAIAGGVSQSGGNNPLRTFSLLYTSDCNSPTATTIPAASPSSTSTVPSTATAISSSTATSAQPTVAISPTSPTSTATQVSAATATVTPTSTATNTANISATATHTATATATFPGISTSTPTECPVTFTDVAEDSTFYAYIRCLACRGIISGYGDGTFRPGNEITRGQIAKIVSNAAGFSEDPGVQIYEDVDSTNTFYTWINRLFNRGFMGGYPCGTVLGEPCNPPENRPYFRPFANATRGQLAKIVANAAGLSGTPSGVFYTDVPEDNPFYVWIIRLTEPGVMSGYECGGPGEPCDSENRPYFRPFNNVTRGQASKIVANTFFPNCQTPTW